MPSSTNWYYNTEFTPLYTVVYTTHDGRTIYERNVPIRTVVRIEEPDLETGDTSAIEDFLGGFGNAKK